MKILITGTTGLIGSSLIKRLIGDGHKITATIHKTNPTEYYDGVSYITGDLRDYEFCKKITLGQDIVFNCAANTSNAVDTVDSPLVHVTPNVTLNNHLINATYENKVKKYIFISSSTIYPPSGENSVKETDFIFDEPYPVYFPVGWMKRFGEVLCDMYSNHIPDPMTCIVIRPANIYGPGDKFDFNRCHVTPATIRKVVDKHNPIKVWGDGKDVRDIIYIDDFIDGMVTVMDNCDEYGVFNIGSNTSYNINEILKATMEVENYESTIEYISGKPSMIPIRKIDSNKMKDKFGWEAKTSLKEGIEKTIKWYKENYNGK
ncbi:MAG: NAD-dependent epimerase/dehydratase family protein [Pelagibacteraceae bacterium]|nr:NAD-dependent epimerase/dehydratase family protein [Pelagibacteraceae bacterium]